VGPGWNARVYAVVRQCPAGFVTTYGQVATLLGSPRVARHVGYALAALAFNEEAVPWHRVINSQGRISHRGDVKRATKQERLLEREGVVFDLRGRVDLRRFLYPYPDFRWPEDPVEPDGFVMEPEPTPRRSSRKR
jgi:methylated-DNA-protein-cysteine methyltransferase-like protein